MPTEDVEEADVGAEAEWSILTDSDRLIRGKLVLIAGGRCFQRAC
jgi:hypothetical protein